MVAGCLAAPRLTGYQAKGFLLYAPASQKDLAAVEAIENFLEEAASYLGLAVQSAGTLSIYVYRWRLDLWRHLDTVCPQWRWRRAACCEIEGGYMIGVSGTRDSPLPGSDLRHELTHYLLASHFSDVAPWIDEGLAGVLEREIPGEGLEDHTEGVHRILKEAVSQDLKSLLSVLPGRKLSHEQYRLAWAWTYALLTGIPEGKSRVIEYLTRTHSGLDQEKLFASVWGADLEHVLEWLTRTTVPAGAPASGESSGIAPRG